MIESWLDPITAEDIKYYIESQIGMVEDFVAEKGDKDYIAKYVYNNGMFKNKEVVIMDELGATHNRIDPNAYAGMFEIIRKKNQGRIINGETYEQWAIKEIKQRIENYKNNGMAQVEIKVAKQKENLNKFIKEYGLSEESEPNC